MSLYLFFPTRWNTVDVEFSSGKQNITWFNSHAVVYEALYPQYFPEFSEKNNAYILFGWDSNSRFNRHLFNQKNLNQNFRIDLQSYCKLKHFVPHRLDFTKTKIYFKCKSVLISKQNRHHSNQS